VFGKDETKLGKHRVTVFRMISEMASQWFDGSRRMYVCGPAKKTLRGFLRAVYQHVEGELRGRKKAFKKSPFMYNLAVKNLRLKL